MAWSVTWKGCGHVALVYRDDAGEYASEREAVHEACTKQWAQAMGVADTVAVVSDSSVRFIKGGFWDMLDGLTEWSK